jgi:endonuclease G, mitochondrial
MAGDAGTVRTLWLADLHPARVQPGLAKADPKQREDYLIDRPHYVLSYNATNQTPNWGSWQLRKEDIGNADQRNKGCVDRPSGTR